jgi:sigma-B regulation protein RsbU (phosphoserine phosphatase)
MTACDIVYRLNNLLYESTTENNYVTFFYAVVNTESKKIIYTNAGHNAPILLRKNGEIVRLQTGGIVIGFLQNFEYRQEELNFTPGDILLLYTDGITETMNARNEEFGEERLIATLKANKDKNVYDIRKAIIQEVQKFSARKAQDDDMTLLVCKFEESQSQ